jgi:CheY-like chemotaxis protein
MAGRLEVTVGENGLQALQLTAVHFFDALLADLHRPVMDGFEATRLIRQSPRAFVFRSSP